MYFNYIFYWVIWLVINNNFAQVIVIWITFWITFLITISDSLRKMFYERTTNQNLSQVFFNMSNSLCIFSPTILDLDSTFPSTDYKRLISIYSLQICARRVSCIMYVCGWIYIYIYDLIVVIRVLGKFVSNSCHPKISYKMNLTEPTLT